MEELTPDWDGAMEQVEGVSVSNYIDSVIDEQLRLLLMTAPIVLLPIEEVYSRYSPTRRADGSGRITLDTQVLRPVSLQMTGWKMPVTRFIDESHPLYELQFNRYTRGGVAKPVAVYTHDGQGNKVIDYFSLPTNLLHTIQSLRCVLCPGEKSQNFTLEPLLVDMLCYRCAAAVYSIMGNKPMADVMLSNIAFRQQ